MANDRPPSGFGRLLNLAGTGLKLLAAKGSPESAARALAHSLGELRGVALKVGQLYSYVDGLLPEETQAAYQQALAVLRSTAPPTSPEAAARIFQEELGVRPEVFFSAWAPTAFAAASIGEVHRATLVGEGEVAVKVQYGGIAQAVATELSFGMVAKLLGPVGSKFALQAQVAEVRARLSEELDYRHEGQAQTEFRALFEGVPGVRIPRVVARASTGRVLTTEFVHGLTFEQACAAPPAQRRQWAETLWRFVFHGLFRGLFNADPHPGNYLFGDDHVWFLDFGCTRRLEPERVAAIRLCHAAAAAGDVNETVEAGARTVDLPAQGEQARLGRDYLKLCFEPILTRGPYRIRPAYTRRLYEELRKSVGVMVKRSAREVHPLPADVLFLNRLQLGFYSVLARLDVDVDYGALDGSLVAGLGQG